MKDGIKLLSFVKAVERFMWTKTAIIVPRGVNMMSIKEKLEFADLKLWELLGDRSEQAKTMRLLYLSILNKYRRQK